MIQPITSTNRNTPVPTINPDDLQQHIEDDMPIKPKRRRNDPLVNAIRDSKLVYVRWSMLTAEEKRAAYVVMFTPDGY